MNRFVVMVDAGYLLRQSIELVSQRGSSSRADLEVLDAAALVGVLLNKSRATLALGGKELLRVYWYDGVPASGLTAQQRALIDVDDVQFRAGTIDVRGQQKGVDSLIVTDLIELTTHRAICDAILVTGDSDLAVGIELAQRRGVRIAVLGVEEQSAGVPHHQSFEITSRADRVGRLGLAELGSLLRYAPLPFAGAQLSSNGSASPAQDALLYSSGAAAATGTGAAANPPLDAADQAQIAAAVQAFVEQQAQRLAGGAIDPHTRRIDGAIDAALLHHVFLTLGRGKLTEAERVFARHVFRTQIQPPGVA